MSDREKDTPTQRPVGREDERPTHPRILAAVEAMKTPAALELPPAWAEVVEDVRSHVNAALAALDRFRSDDVPAPDPATLPAMWERDEPGAALWRAGWPAAVTFLWMLDPVADDSILTLLTQALDELSPERRADLYGIWIDALADGAHAGIDGPPELLVGAEALARRIGGGS